MTMFHTSKMGKQYLLKESSAIYSLNFFNTNGSKVSSMDHNILPFSYTLEMLEGNFLLIR